MSTTSRRRQRGVSMISAIFLILVIAVLGAYLANVATTEHTTAALDLQGAKAYQAAYAGIQWGAYQVLTNGSCPASPTNFALPGGLSGFSVTITCSATGYTEGGSSKSIYLLTSTGCSPAGGACPGTAGGYYVERQIQATLDR